MAVARHNKVANRMPIHIEGAVAPAAACPAKVSHRNAPGAMSAIAFIVRPVRPKVFFISVVLSAISVLLSMSCSTNDSEHRRSGSGHHCRGLQARVLRAGTAHAAATTTVATSVDLA